MKQPEVVTRETVKRMVREGVITLVLGLLFGLGRWSEDWVATSFWDKIQNAVPVVMVVVGVASLAYAALTFRKLPRD